MRSRKPDSDQKNSTVPAHTSTVAAPNRGERSKSPLSSSSLYDTPIIATDTTNSASDAGRLLSAVASVRAWAVIRSIRRALDTSHALTIAAMRKIATNTTSV